MKKAQGDTDEWNEDKIKRLDFTNKRLHQKSEAKAYINNAHEAIVDYYRVFAKRIKSLHHEPRYQIFTIHHKIREMVNYYLLQWTQTTMAQVIITLKYLRAFKHTTLLIYWFQNECNLTCFLGPKSSSDLVS